MIVQLSIMWGPADKVWHLQIQFEPIEGFHNRGLIFFESESLTNLLELVLQIVIHLAGKSP